MKQWKRRYMRNIVIKKIRIATESRWGGKNIYKYVYFKINHSKHTLEVYTDAVNIPVTALINFVLSDKDMKY